MKPLKKEIRTSREMAHQKGSQLLKARGTFGKRTSKSKAPLRKEVRAPQEGSQDLEGRLDHEEGIKTLESWAS